MTDKKKLRVFQVSQCTRRSRWLCTATLECRLPGRPQLGWAGISPLAQEPASTLWRGEARHSAGVPSDS